MLQSGGLWKGGKGDYGWLLRVDINESRFVAACTATCLEDSFFLCKRRTDKG